MYDEAAPRNMVTERVFDKSKATTAPPTTDRRSPMLEMSAEEDSTAMQAMIIGSRPLHGMRELVIIAIRLSRGESMMRQPVTPTALQPSPISMVREISGVFFLVYTSNKAVIYPYLLFLVPLSIFIFGIAPLLYLDTVNQLSQQGLCQFLYVRDFVQ